MNAAELAARTMRTRTSTEITRDMLAACRRLGEIAMVSELGRVPPDRGEIRMIAEGLRRLLVEDASREAGQ